MADGERRPETGRQNRARIILEHHHQRVGAGNAVQHGKHRLAVGPAFAGVFGEQMGDDFRIRLAGKNRAVSNQLVLQFGKVLDNAVMNDRHTIDEMRVGIGLVRHAMGRPARVCDTDCAR
ncbi:hypothetical protein D3C73_707960 [compost metagenome]